MDTNAALDRIASENATRMAATVLVAVQAGQGPDYAAFQQDRSLNEVFLARICSLGQPTKATGTGLRLPPDFFSGAIAIALRGASTVDTAMGVDWCYQQFASDPTEQFGRALDAACVRAKRRAIKSAVCSPWRTGRASWISRRK
jgi:hypothetical protein